MKLGALLLGYACFAVGCARTTERAASFTLPAVLTPPNGADSVKQAVHPGYVAEVSYSLQVPYPAKSIVTEVEAKAASMKWQPLKEDFWNPGIPTSSVRGWTSYLDHSQVEPAAMHQWQSCWRNKTGDLLSYSFWYRTEPFSGAAPPSVPGNSTLLVSAQLLQRDIAEQLREQGMKNRVHEKVPGGP